MNVNLTEKVKWAARSRSKQANLGPTSTMAERRDHSFSNVTAFLSGSMAKAQGTMVPPATSAEITWR